MDLCYAESETYRLTNYKKLQTRNRNRCQKTGHYGYKCSALNAVPSTVGNSNLQAAKNGPMRESDAVAKTQNRNGQKNRSG